MIVYWRKADSYRICFVKLRAGYLAATLPLRKLASTIPDCFHVTNETQAISVDEIASHKIPLDSVRRLVKWRHEGAGRRKRRDLEAMFNMPAHGIVLYGDK